MLINVYVSHFPLKPPLCDFLNTVTWKNAIAILSTLLTHLEKLYTVPILTFITKFN